LANEREREREREREFGDTASGKASELYCRVVCFVSGGVFVVRVVVVVDSF